jgi:transcriptional regulator with XRE-family HTH domain
VPAEQPPDWLLQQRRDIGRRIRQAREQRGLSQEQLAHTAGISRQTMYRAELGTHSTGIDALLKIARVLGVSVAELMPNGEA